MILLALLLAGNPPPLSLDPFMDEEAAANALDAQLVCLGTTAFDRRNDKRPTKDVAADVVRICRAEGDTLRSTLTEVYRRKPALLPAGQNAEQAATAYVNEMNGRVQLVVEEGRKKK